MFGTHVCGVELRARPVTYCVRPDMSLFGATLAHSDSNVTLISDLHPHDTEPVSDCPNPASTRTGPLTLINLVWFGLIRDRGPRHRNDLLSGRFALASSCAVATYWSMPPLTTGGLLLCTPPGPAADGGLHGRWGLVMLHSAFVAVLSYSKLSSSTPPPHGGRTRRETRPPNPMPRGDRGIGNRGADPACRGSDHGRMFSDAVMRRRISDHDEQARRAGRSPSVRSSAGFADAHGRTAP